MKLDESFKLMDICPNEDLMNFDFGLISEQEWHSSDNLKEMYPLLKDIDAFTLLRCEAMAFDGTLGSLKRTWLESSNPIVDIVKRQVEVLEQHYNGTALIVALDRLPAGSCIEEHVDTYKFSFWSNIHRIHLPLVTDSDVQFRIDHVDYYFPPGQFFELDNQRLHGVRNNSTIGRIHLVCDLYPNN